MKNLLRVVWNTIPWHKTDWRKLCVHVFTSLLIVLGTTGANHGDFVTSAEEWFWGVLIYIGGFLQVGEKDDLSGS